MSENPFRPSQHIANDGDVAVEAAGAKRELFAIARQTFLAWEKLRIVYVLLLGIPCITAVLFFGLLTPGTIIMLVVCGIFANACYFAGPFAETYVRWLGYSGTSLRWYLFVGGTMLTAILALLALRAM